MITPYFKSEDKNFYLLQGDTMELLPKFDFKFNMVFADPPYFLSNNGLSIQSGEIVSVNKGNWDKSEGFDFINNFNHFLLKLLIKSKPSDLSHFPLFTETISPLCIDKPLFERKYGGSAKTISNLKSNCGKSSIVSP